MKLKEEVNMKCQNRNEIGNKITPTASWLASVLGRHLANMRKLGGLRNHGAVGEGRAECSPGGVGRPTLFLLLSHEAHKPQPPRAAFIYYLKWKKGGRI